jgi:alkanesulfonate monooxygenase SsuD/methylene tetrahydromethanopterin reductase-like flavin-dependent oxidoreductase (luciferase family)
VQFSIWPSFERPWAEVADLAAFADRTGWHAFWFADHFMPNTDDDSPSDGDALECWSVLAALAATTSRVRLTSMVSPVTIHHPVTLARRAVTVDHVSGGRVTLGLGAGWQVNEHAAYGFELPAVGERVTRFAEALRVVHSLLHADGRVDFAGDHYRLSDAPFSPAAVQRPLPLLVGTGSPRMMRLTARFADQWNTWGDPAQLAARTELFMSACDAVGRDPATVWRSAQAMIFLTDDSAAAATMRDRVPAGRCLVGGPNELIDLLATYVDAGVDEFAVPDFTLGDTMSARRETLERLQADVLSAIT